MNADVVPPKAYRTPSGVTREVPFKGGKGFSKGRGRVKATADWLLVREGGVPTAEVFYVSYELEPRDPTRPVTFLFNGGPGAASAFLHLGTAGPRRIAFGPTGSVLPPPAKLIDNLESWLPFTDLVFVDPVGTGLSRTVAESRLEQQGVDAEDEKLAKRTKDLPDAKKPFFKVKRDIDVLCEFVSQWLSVANRWESPVSIAGESYGGFRVGKMVRALPERGVAVNGAIMISPAIDFLHLIGGDYDILHWLNTLPTMALTAAFHGRARGRFKGLKPAALRAAAEEFGELTLAPVLIRGDRTPPAERARVLGTLADLIGLPTELVERCNGRVPIDRFARELLRDQGLVCGLYDAAITGSNVFPDREGSPNPDPTLAGIMTSFSAGINALLRDELGLKTSREYVLLNEETWKFWADDRMDGYWARQLDCADDMRYGLGISPNLKLMVCHGWYDLVTTYFSSTQALSLQRLPESVRRRVSLVNYYGGHMFYTWESSRKAMQRDAARVIAAK